MTRAEEIPERFGPYHVLGPLPPSDVGPVYRARDTRQDRNVVLQVVRPTGLTALAAQQLANDAVAVTALTHAGLETVYDGGQIGVLSYLAKEDIAATPLADLSAGGPPIAPRLAAELVRKAALALADAHSVGVVHGRLTPFSLRVGRKGDPVVVGLGLAALPLSEATLPYAAPERLSGAMSATVLGDVYSLGVILHELLRKGGTTPGLDATVRKATAAAAKDRFASMNEFAEALRRAVADDPKTTALAPPLADKDKDPPPISETDDPKHAPPAWMLVAALVLVGMLFVLLGLTIFSGSR